MANRTPKLCKLYRVGFFIDNSMLDDEYRYKKIGEVVELSFGYFCRDSYTFYEYFMNNGKSYPRFAYEFNADEFDRSPSDYIKRINADFGKIEKSKNNYGNTIYILNNYLYFLTREEAENASKIALKRQENYTMPTIDELCEKLNKDKNLEYEYYVCDSIRNGIGQNFPKGILYRSKWGCSYTISIDYENKLFSIEAAGWHRYTFKSEEAFLACLYGFFDGGESKESRRYDYSYSVGS